MKCLKHVRKQWRKVRLLTAIRSSLALSINVLHHVSENWTEYNYHVLRRVSWLLFCWELFFFLWWTQHWEYIKYKSTFSFYSIPYITKLSLYSPQNQNQAGVRRSFNECYTAYSYYPSEKSHISLLLWEFYSNKSFSIWFIVQKRIEEQTRECKRWTMSVYWMKIKHVSLRENAWVLVKF